MKYVIVTQPELADIANDLIRRAADDRDILAGAAISAIGGDRIRCCDEGIVARTRFGNVAGIATIAPHGESGEESPEIVGVFVGRRYRGKGHGKELLIRAINRCEERGLRPNMTVVTQGGRALIESLPPEARGKCGEIRLIPGIDLMPF